MAIQFPQLKKTPKPALEPVGSLASPYAAPTASIEDDRTEELGQYNNSKFYSPTGRIGRVKYMMYPLVFVLLGMLVFGIVVMAMGGIAGLAQMQDSQSSGMVMVLGLLMVILGIAWLYIGFATTVRRLNDLNRTGWLSLLLFVPIVGYLLHFYLMIARGDEGRNDYGLPGAPPSTAMKVSAFLLFGLVALGGIMAALAIPAYQQYVEKAQVAKIQANGTQNKPTNPTGTPTAKPTTTMTPTADPALALPAGEPPQNSDIEKPLMVEANQPAVNNVPAQNTTPNNGVNFAEMPTDTAPSPNTKAKGGSISYEEFTKLSEGTVYQDPVRVKK